ncbi:MAG: DUF2617 family protein [Phycisphaerales bacterium]|nr:DUF2617 family protein [Phycisphaerales bacterium]
MATTINSTARLQSYQTLLYARSLRSEFAHCADSRTAIQDYYTLNLFIMPGSHACVFTSVDGCATEYVTDNTLGNTEIGLVESIICSAEKDFEHHIPRTKINYITAAQTEQLSSHIYNDTFEELDQLARDQDAIAHRWNDRAGSCLSLVDIQKFADQVHIQSYHLIAAESLVLRTQTIFELKTKK